ncbi:MAG: glutamate mutase L, partial [Bacteroidales bacterium]|nr:glutamate mutase L [Bacteroidales bacterium]
MPTPSAVLKAAKLLGEGTDNQKGIGDLIVADVGGATTDI